MKNTTFVSAGAGSGKTYRLTQEIARMIKEGKCQAEEIILTTFTEAAAKELREKVRSTLYAKGLYEAAMNIDNAAIGTIHSIAYQFVSRYWYLLGISANVSIMDTEGSKFCISQSLASLPTDEDLSLFDKMCRSFNLTIPKTSQLDFGFWKKELKKIIDKTVELCIDETQLEDAKKESKNLLKNVMGFSDHIDIDDYKITDLKDLAEQILAEVSLPKSNREKIEPKMPAIRAYTNRLTDAKPFAAILGLASEIKALKNNTIKAKYAEEIAFAAWIAEQLPHSKQVKNLVENYIDTIFRIAIQWKKEYEEFKRKRCLLDFGDLLQKFYELLNKKEVIDDIQSRYKVAFVDEFQDCSPLQVKSFERLSELMKKSVWVGDIKQAIYGFRGTNTELIKSVIDKVKEEKNKDGNKLDRLENCWRSNKTIVNLVNNIFCEKVFKGELNDDLIRLYMPTRTESDPPAPQERELRHMHFVCGKKEDVPEALAEKVKEIISIGTFKPNEIAILYHDNPDVKKCAKALKEQGITYNVRFDRESDEIESSTDAISSFINAVVSFAARANNELSKAIIANRIEEGFSASELLTNRLQFIESNGKEWLSNLNIIGRISDIRNAISNQSVSAAVETIVVELNLADLIKRIDPSAPTHNYCAVLQSKAVTYEGLCANFGLSSTLVGFVEYLMEHPIEYPGDDNGVSVMTYHKSKGLEWPCVILCSLHKVPVDAKKTFFGVLTNNTKSDTQLRLVPSAVKGFVSSVKNQFEDNTFFQEICRATTNEAKRLMYVGMTRPKEQLILTTYGTKKGDDWLTSIGCDSIDSHSKDSVINWGKAEWNHIAENYTIPKLETIGTEEEYTVLKQPTERPSFDTKFVSPSKAKAAKQQYTVEQCANFAERISAKAADGKDNTIGDFIHHVMCLWNGDKSIIEPLAKAYGVRVDVDAVATSVTKFWSWMEKAYGRAIQIDRELPFSFTKENGQIVSGEIDLVYRTAEGDVLLDYKTYQGSPAHLIDENHDFHTGKKYGAQIALYEDALKRMGCSIRDRLVCYVSLGVIIKMK